MGFQWAADGLYACWIGEAERIAMKESGFG